MFVGNHGDDLVVVGGREFTRSGMERPSDDVAVLDAGTFSWRSYPRPPFDHPTGYPIAAVTGDVVLISGFSCEIGTETHDSSGPDCALGPRQTARLDLDSGRWTRLASPATPAEQTGPLGSVDADLFTTPGVPPAVGPGELAARQRACRSVDRLDQWVQSTPPFGCRSTCQAGGGARWRWTSPRTARPGRPDQRVGVRRRYAPPGDVAGRHPDLVGTHRAVGQGGRPRLGVSLHRHLHGGVHVGPWPPVLRRLRSGRRRGVRRCHGGHVGAPGRKPPPVFGAVLADGRTLPAYSVRRSRCCGTWPGPTASPTTSEPAPPRRGRHLRRRSGNRSTSSWTDRSWSAAGASHNGRPRLLTRRRQGRSFRFRSRTSGAALVGPEPGSGRFPPVPAAMSTSHHVARRFRATLPEGAAAPTWRVGRQAARRTRSSSR